MSEETEDLEIVLDDVPEVVEPEIQVEPPEKVDPKPESKPIAAEEGIEALKAKLADEKAAREREKSARELAERQRDEAAANAHKAQTETQDTNLHLVTNAIALVKQQQEGAKARYREARANGDVEAEIEAQDALSASHAQLLQLEQGKSALEKAPKVEAPQRQVSDPVEEVASRLTPRSANWVRQHPQFATDQRLMQKMIAAHNIAVADGYTPDSDDYFAAVEDTLKIHKQEPVVDNALSSAAAPMQRRAAPAAAPVSRSGQGPAANPNVVRLSPQEREMATLMGMSSEEYARNKLALTKEGKLH